MKTILVPVDFSSNAHAAVDAARLMARKTNARIYLLHAYVPYVPTEVNVPLDGGLYAGMESSMKDSLQASLDALLEEGLQAEAIWAEGPVVKAVIHHAAELGADLVIIGRTGKGGFLDKIFGSVATAIVKELESAPVLTIPPDSTLGKIEKVVYATRLEHDEEEAIRKVVAFSKALGARLQFFKLNSAVQPDIQPDVQFMEPLKKEFGLTDEDFVVIDIGRNTVVSEIEKQAVALDADILVVSKKEKGFLEELLVDPSITRKLLLNTKIPLMTCRLEGYGYS